ncbi:hypothetical protein CLIB1444_11S01288 [[Candida] jaroonii]|uniref:Uncharacterized protein n=1 Tax=[Candida] jaroonii TaxID=467808 RepID=A0ACA9YCK4_9ASCO|nr:hypothetical protein CLIB1444_11S01288 [[Candida] jaroonii]
MIQLAPELIDKILGYLPKRTRDAFYNIPNETRDFPAVYQLGLGFGGVLVNSVSTYKKYGALHPRTNFIDIDDFIQYYNSPPFIPSPKRLAIYEDMKYHELNFPDNIHYMESSFDTNVKSKLTVYNSIANPLSLLDSSVKEIDELTADYRNFDDSLIDRYSVQKLFIEAEDGKLAKLENTKIPVELLINNPLHDVRGLPQCLTVLRLTISEDLKDIDLSYLKNLEVLRLSLDGSNTDFKLKCPESLVKFCVSCSDDITFSGNVLLPPTLKYAQFHLFNLNHELPEDLETIDLVMCEVSYKIPKGVKTVYLESCVFMEPLELPPSLESLNIVNVETIPQDLSHLTKLNFLVIEVDDIFSVNPPISDPIILPPSLRYLKCTVSEFNFKMNDGLKDVSFLSMNPLIGTFPSSIKHLELGETTYENIRNLPPKVETLELLSMTSSTGEPWILPSSLKMLFILACDIQNIIFNEGLEFLQIEGCFITQQIIDNFPKSLKTLILTHNPLDQNISFDFSKLSIRELVVSDLNGVTGLILPPSLKLLCFIRHGEGFIDYGFEPDYSRVREARILDETSGTSHWIVNGVLKSNSCESIAEALAAL